MNGRQRLTLSLLASAGIHALVLTMASVQAVRFAPARPLARALPVTVSIVERTPSASALPPGDRPENTLSSAVSPAPNPDAPALDRAVSLLSPPDFSEVQMLPTPIPIHMRFEFVVTGDGSISELRLLSSSPVPTGLLPVIERALRTARFTPAMAQGHAVPGLFEMEVEVQPESGVEQLGKPPPRPPPR